MANMPANPNYANNVQAGTADTSLVESLTGGGAKYFGQLSPTVVSNSNTIATRGDQALYDTVAGAYVSIDKTSCGTTLCPKNGQ